MKELFELIDSFDEAKKQRAGENSFGYIYTKAARYLEVGPEIYRASDFFGQPDINSSTKDLLLVEMGCRQVLEGKGLVPEDPFTELRITGFTLLFELFHFEMVKRNTNYIGSIGPLDYITFEHAMDKEIVSYYNLVRY